MKLFHVHHHYEELGHRCSVLCSCTSTELIDPETEQTVGYLTQEVAEALVLEGLAADVTPRSEE